MDSLLLDYKGREKSTEVIFRAVITIRSDLKIIWKWMRVEA